MIFNDLQNDILHDLLMLSFHKIAYGKVKGHSLWEIRHSQKMSYCLKVL